MWQQQFVGSEVIASECHFSATGTPQLLTAWLPDGTVWFQKRYAWDGVDYTSESRFEPPWERGVENQEVGTKNLRGLSLGTVVLEHELPPRLPVSIDFFQRADLTGADLRYLDLTRFDFTGAILRDTEFEFTILEDADLSGAIALTPAQLLHTKHEGAILYPEPIELWKRSVHSRWQAHD